MNQSNLERIAGMQNDRVTIDPRALKITTKKARQACTTCQQLKMRCNKMNEQSPCLRCLKLGKECQLKQRSVRQSWVKKQESQITQLQKRLKEVEGLVGNKEGQNDLKVYADDTILFTERDFCFRQNDVLPSVYPNVLYSKNDDDRANYMLESINIFASIPMTIERLLHPQSWLPS